MVWLLYGEKIEDMLIRFVTRTDGHRTTAKMTKSLILQCSLCKA